VFSIIETFWWGVWGGGFKLPFDRKKEVFKPPPRDDWIGAPSPYGHTPTHTGILYN
jgi:hypothetical protein